MAHGIESRVPFLDYRLVEFCFRLPDSLRIGAGVTKALLRAGVPGRHSRRREEPDRQEGVYGATGELDARGRATIRWRISSSPSAPSPGTSRRRDRVEKALSEHRAGLDRTVPLYRLLTLEMWSRLFQDGEGISLFHVPAASSALRAEPGRPAVS